MSKRNVVQAEKSFQQVANEHAHNSIERMRQHLDDEEQRDRISSEDALFIQVRSDWHIPGESGDLTEYEILLGTGGPATRIRGDLSEHKEPMTATFEYQDWFKPWTAANDLTDEQEATLLQYAQQFWFGE